ncbi:MAG: hypothetical protein IJE49_04955 [Agathobacter sp.]|nr:hypothetical protein [Agathobacter sp.]
MGTKEDMEIIDVRMGQLSKYDIEKEMDEGNLKIIGKSEECLKAASYDLTPTLIAMSTKFGMLENVYREDEYGQDKYYIMVHAKDCVLIVSNEFLVLPSNIAGYVSSRVSKLVDGFGHVSTTIDPNWHGACLIALSNPTNQPIKIYLGGNLGENMGQNQLATVTFHYLNTECKCSDIETMQRGMRFDLLEKIMYTNRRGIRAGFNKMLHFNRKAFTDYFFCIYRKYFDNVDEAKWEEFLNVFSYMKMDEEVVVDNKKKSAKAQKRAVDFVITESIWTKMFYFFQKRKEGIGKFLTFMILFGAMICLYCELIPQEVIDFLKSAKEILPWI